MSVHFPPYLFGSLSLSSSASCTPVDAHDGTIDLPMMSLSKITSTSIVGFPLLSNTSRACTSFTLYILYDKMIKWLNDETMFFVCLSYVFARKTISLYKIICIDIISLISIKTFQSFYVVFGNSMKNIVNDT